MSQRSASTPPRQRDCVMTSPWSSEHSPSAAACQATTSEAPPPAAADTTALGMCAYAIVALVRNTSCQTQLGAGLEGAELAKEVDVGNCVVFGACVASGSMNGTVEVPVVVAGVEGL